MTFDPDSPSSDRGSRAHVPKRGPQSPVEAWAIETLVTVAGMDPDHATVHNGRGLDRFDSSFGSSLAAQWSKRGALSEKQWAIVVRMARKYRGQVAEPEPIPLPPSPAETNAARIGALKRTLRAALDRLDAIARDAVPPSDPAFGSRCYRSHAPEDGRDQVCPGCAYRIGGPMEEHRNAVCKGVEFVCGVQAEVAELEGRTADAEELRKFCSAARIEDAVAETKPTRMA